ncbi:MAG: DUF3800 domain-containing protein, partial [Rhodoferax sp.]|nr:DUF3800 domain-containing protein [Rhodoferax sp.]
IDPAYPLFVLGGVIMEADYAQEVLTPAIADFKRLKDTGFRAEFYDQLNALIRSLEFSVLACAIRKDAHLARYGMAALDPYLMSLDILVERFCMDVGDIEDGGLIVAERRGPTLDHELELAWLNLKIQGTRYMQAKQVERRIQSLNLKSKAANVAGLQLADLVVTPIGRQVLGKPVKDDYAIVESKFRRSPHGRIEGYGLMVLPK